MQHVQQLLPLGRVSASAGPAAGGWSVTRPAQAGGTGSCAWQAEQRVRPPCPHQRHQFLQCGAVTAGSRLAVRGLESRSNSACACPHDLQRGLRAGQLGFEPLVPAVHPLQLDLLSGPPRSAASRTTPRRPERDATPRCGRSTSPCGAAAHTYRPARSAGRTRPGWSACAPAEPAPAALRQGPDGATAGRASRLLRSAPCPGCYAISTPACRSTPHRSADTRQG
jgi:hypothetical protein